MSMQRKAPTRRVSDHYHPDVWMRDEQHRFEDGLTEELKEMRTEMRGLGNRMLLLMGGLGLMAFILPLIAPIVRAMVLGT